MLWLVLSSHYDFPDSITVFVFYSLYAAQLVISSSSRFVLVETEEAKQFRLYRRVCLSIGVFLLTQ